MYSRLTSASHDLTAYNAFVRCTMQRLRQNPGITFKAKSGGFILVWPILHFFVVDKVELPFTSLMFGPIMHHGIKNALEVETDYFINLTVCKLDRDKVVNPFLADHLAEHYRRACMKNLTCTEILPAT